MSRAETAIEAAEAEWSRHVEEPPGPGSERIDEYIRSSSTGLGLAWSWVSKYVRNSQFAWCGAFVAFCYGVAGLRRSIRKKRIASTYRLWKWSKGNSRRIDPGCLRPGDIAVIGPLTGKRYGQHIVLVVDVGDDSISTIEGNATGELPDGGYREGVVRRQRPFEAKSRRTSRVLYGVRPLPEDFG